VKRTAQKRRTDFDDGRGKASICFERGKKKKPNPVKKKTKTIKMGEKEYPGLKPPCRSEGRKYQTKKNQGALLREKGLKSSKRGNRWTSRGGKRGGK